MKKLSHPLGKTGMRHPLIKPSHRGLLHEKLGIPQGQPIPVAEIKKAEHSSSPALRREARFADNARKWHK